MSIVPRTIRIKAGDSLANLAFDLLDDYSGWRELATINDLDIFKPLCPCQALTIPDKEAAENRLKSIGNNTIKTVNEEIQNRVKQLLDSREAKVISKLIGFDNNDREQLLRDLDLTPLSNSLSTLISNSSQNNNLPWQLIEWVL